MIGKIPFNRPFLTTNELTYISEARSARVLAGDGPFSKRCESRLESMTTTRKSLLVHSCTAALEMAALLLDISEGDEIIMPSYTFTSTANAFVLRGAIPVFIDIREDTLNINERLIEPAITPRTKAIVPVHYAGVACEMDTILSCAQQYNLKIVEDAAQGILASYKGRMLGCIGDLGSYSFHATKNVVCGEGGTLLLNDPALVHQAEIIREKGTDRSSFLRGDVDKYTWQGIGSSFSPNEITAAVLLSQLEEAEEITAARLALWHRYNKQLLELEELELLRRPAVPTSCQHNAHSYYVVLASEFDRSEVIAALRANNIEVASHYVPLHSSSAGKRYGRAHGQLPVTEEQSERIVRLPLWIGLSAEQQSYIVDVMTVILKGMRRRG
jgi:dTDP-4-amino-4,6-dideoxygalactose transaminase